MFPDRIERGGLCPRHNERIPLVYRGHDVGAQFCPDIIINGTVVVELKAVESIAPLHKAQLITYLKLTGLPVGLLMNFNVDLLKNGVRRVVRPGIVQENLNSLPFSLSPVRSWQAAVARIQGSE